MGLIDFYFAIFILFIVFNCIWSILYANIKGHYFLTYFFHHIN